MGLGDQLMKIVLKVGDVVELARRFRAEPVAAMQEVVTQVRATDAIGSTDLNTSVRVYDFKATLGTVTCRPGSTVRVPLLADRAVGALGIVSEQMKLTWTGTIRAPWPNVPPIPEERSCWIAPTVDVAVANLNELLRFGTTTTTEDSDIGIAVAPRLRNGWPNA